jgi:CMP-N-acetylneuraminic acid synthetase
MYKGKKILGLIPARGGSKGLPKKNIFPLCEKPLIAWTIEQALNSRYIDKVFVSTDDPEIANVSRKHNAEVPFLRPEEFARDNSPTIDTIIHALDYFDRNNDPHQILALLEPTSPLRKKGDLDNAISLLIDSSSVTETVVSLGEVHLENPFITKVIDRGFVKPLIKNESHLIFQRQQLPKVYFPYGVIYAATAKTLRKEKTFYQETTIPYFIERWQNYEIDDIYDLSCIEAIMKNKFKEML